jgi:hypothetical protein
MSAKLAVWKVQNAIYSMRDPNLANFRNDFPKCEVTPVDTVEKTKSLFLGLDLFFVKVMFYSHAKKIVLITLQVSEFMYIVPSFPHLRGLELVVKYRELEENPVWPPQPGKWRQDPNTNPNQHFTPRPKYYLNGEFVRQGEILRTKTSTVSFGERRVPRRGLVQVFPGEPDYERLAREQGLLHLLPANQLTNGTAPHANGFTPPHSDKSKSVNGGSPNLGSLSEAGPSGALPNGVPSGGVSINGVHENGVYRDISGEDRNGTRNGVDE